MKITKKITKKKQNQRPDLSVIIRDMPLGVLEYLFEADDKSLENFQLARINHARNLERHIHEVQRDQVRALCEAELANLLSRYRDEIRQRTKQASWAKPVIESEPRNGE